MGGSEVDGFFFSVLRFEMGLFGDLIFLLCLVIFVIVGVLVFRELSQRVS